MKNRALFSSNDKSKKLKCRLLQFLHGALSVKMEYNGVVLFYIASRKCSPNAKL